MEGLNCLPQFHCFPVISLNKLQSAISLAHPKQNTKLKHKNCVQKICSFHLDQSKFIFMITQNKETNLTRDFNQKDRFVLKPCKHDSN